MATVRDELAAMLNAAQQQHKTAEWEFEQAKAQTYTLRGMVLALEQVLNILDQTGENIKAAPPA